MGGTGCVPSAYCVGNVYGSDLDVISWDFGMTDGRNIDHGELYYRQVDRQSSEHSFEKSSIGTCWFLTKHFFIFY
jgi:hypothetical protein